MRYWKWLLGTAGFGVGVGALVAYDALKEDQTVVFDPDSEMVSNIKTDPTFSDVERARFTGGGMLPPTGGSGDGNDGDGPPGGDDDGDLDVKEDRDTVSDDDGMDMPGKETPEERSRRLWPDESSMGNALDGYGITCSSINGNARHTGLMYALRSTLAADSIESLPEEHQEMIRRDLDYLESTGMDMDEALSRIGNLPLVNTEGTADQWYDGARSVRGFLCREVFMRAYYSGMREFRGTHDPQDLEGLKSVIRLLDEGRKSWVDPRELLIATEEVSGHINSYVMNYVRSQVDQIVRLRDEGKEEQAGYRESILHDYLNMLSGCELGSKKRIRLLSDENYRIAKDLISQVLGESD